MRRQTITVDARFPRAGSRVYEDRRLTFAATVAEEDEAPVVVRSWCCQDVGGVLEDDMVGVWRLTLDGSTWLESIRVADEPDVPWVWEADTPFRDADAVASHLSGMVWVAGLPYQRCDAPELTVWACGDQQHGDGDPEDGAGIVIPAWATHWLEELKTAMGPGWNPYAPPQAYDHPALPATCLPDVSRTAAVFKAVTALADARDEGPVEVSWSFTYGVEDYEAWADDPSQPETVRAAARRLLEVLDQ